MQCPKCQADMEKVATAHGVVDRCTACKGLWFDLMEHEELKADADIIDIGSEELGRRHNAIDRIHCPVCPNSQMLRMVDPQQPHIWFESCPVCYGRYFDAGEFRDLSEHSLGDLFKRWRAKARD
ncbi:MAG: zf-TFIIB domain-containing protein [Lysobacterales bacterium]|nr:zf-TFIIB domain-containing protein [Xanthomonadales bacterium]MCB1610924.1 zf-TFIIB domain-containing protein [Xanthomonadales bacterium]MCP5475643.1 zf-TFIIB domain-containing protein [Rhodanobacteraceae bacterium]